MGVDGSGEIESEASSAHGKAAAGGGQCWHVAGLAICLKLVEAAGQTNDPNGVAATRPHATIRPAARSINRPADVPRTRARRSTRW